MSPTDRSCHLYVGVIACRGRAPAPTGPLGTPPAHRRWARGTPKRPAPNQPLSPGPRRGFFAAYEAPRVAEQPVKLANLVLQGLVLRRRNDQAGAQACSKKAGLERIDARGAAPRCSPRLFAECWRQDQRAPTTQSTMTKTQKMLIAILCLPSLAPESRSEGGCRKTPASMGVPTGAKS